MILEKLQAFIDKHHMLKRILALLVGGLYGAVVALVYYRRGYRDWLLVN